MSPRPLPVALAALLQVLGGAPSVRAQEPAPAGGQDGVPEGVAEALAPPILPLTVREAVAMALGNNLEIARAEVDVEVAKFDELGSWGAFDWVFDSRLTATDSTREGSGFLSGGAETTTETVRLDVDLTKPLTTGGSFLLHFDTLDRRTDSILFNEPRQREGNLALSYVQPLRRGAWSEYATSLQREAEVAYRRQLEVARGTRQQIHFEVETAYWDLVSAIEQLGVAESAIDLGRNRLEQNQRELEAGVGTEVEVLQARAELAMREEALIQARNDVETAEDVLKKLVFGNEDDSMWDLEIDPVTPLPTDTDIAEEAPHWTTVLGVALDNRSVLRQRGYDVDVARLRAARAASERLARVDLELTASAAAVDDGRLESITKTAEYRFPTYSAAIVYSMPIGNRSAVNAERAARAEVRAALLEYERAALDVTAEVRAAVRNVRYAAEQIEATSESLALAQRQLEAEEARFDNDLSTTFQVLEFQQTLIEAMSNERTARVNYAKALAELENVQGVIGAAYWEDRQ